MPGLIKAILYLGDMFGVLVGEMFWVYPNFSFNGFKIPFISHEGWGKTKGIFNETPMTGSRHKGE